jgi:small subunit ribosomal protein S16
VIDRNKKILLILLRKEEKLVKIRLKRVGTTKKPYYRIVVSDSRNPRDGKFLEKVGIYQPINEQDKQLIFDRDKIKEWFLKGAEPTNIVKRLLNKKGFRFDRALLEKE